MKFVKFLNVKICNTKKADVIKKIIDFLDSSKQHHIVTVNPEFLVMSRKNEHFFNILNSADLSVADGFGILFLSYFLPPRVIEHIRGSDLTNDILLLAEKSNKKVCILNWSGGLSSSADIIKSIKAKYPKLKFIVKSVSRDGGDIDLKYINNFSPHILFVALGAPFQEILINKSLKKIPSVRVAIGVGGTMDFITGEIKRAPLIVRRLELEWLWRLFKQPRTRFKRIVTAVFIFPFFVFKQRFFNPFFYRKNVACFLYKKNSGRIKVFLAERVDLPGHFQLPQGGMDGEDIETAGKRELFEEVGVNSVRVVKTFKNVHKYKYKKTKNGLIYKYANYKGQQQNLIVLEFLGEDSDIDISRYDFASWKWVDIDNILNEVSEIRRNGMVQFLDKINDLKL